MTPLFFGILAFLGQHPIAHIFIITNHWIEKKTFFYMVDISCLMLKTLNLSIKIV